MSQCTTAAQCLKELARVMEQFGIDNSQDAINSKYVKRMEDMYLGMYMARFSMPELWSFAIAEVEGKPCFMDSWLYAPDGARFMAGQHSQLYWCDKYPLETCSWNPPKPKTIMVELLVEDAEMLTNRCVAIERVNKACRQALEREGVK